MARASKDFFYYSFLKVWLCKTTSLIPVKGMRSERSAHLAGAALFSLTHTLTQHLCTANPPPAPQKSLVLMKLPLTLRCLNTLRITITLKVKNCHLASSKIKQSSLFPCFRCTFVCTTPSVIVLINVLKYWKCPILSLVDPNLEGGQHELLRAHHSHRTGHLYLSSVIWTWLLLLDFHQGNMIYLHSNFCNYNSFQC